VVSGNGLGREGRSPRCRWTTNAVSP